MIKNHFFFVFLLIVTAVPVSAIWNNYTISIPTITTIDTGGIGNESDPIFVSWLNLTPPVYSETDPLCPFVVANASEGINQSIGWVNGRVDGINNTISFINVTSQIQIINQSINETNKRIDALNTSSSTNTNIRYDVSTTEIRMHWGMP